MKVAALLFLFLLSSFAPREGGATADRQDAKATLEWGFTKDAKLRYDFGMAVEVDAGGMPIKQDMILGLAMTVTAVAEDGTADLEVLIDRVKIVMAGMIETEYDSDVDDEVDTTPVAEFMAALLKGKFTLKISKRGEIAEVKGFAALIKNAAASHEKAGNMMVANLRKLLAEKQIKGMLQQLLLRLPEKAVGAGDTWTSDVTWNVPMLGTIKLANEPKVKEIDEKDHLAIIKIKVKPSSVSDEDNLGDVGEFEAKGAARWQIAEKRLEASESYLSLKMTFNGQEMPIVMATKLAWSPRDGKPPKKEKPKKPKEE